MSAVYIVWCEPFWQDEPWYVVDVAKTEGLAIAMVEDLTANEQDTYRELGKHYPDTFYFSEREVLE